MNITIKAQEEMEQSFFAIPFWLSPQPDTFLLRSKRFDELAIQDKGEWSAYLLLLAKVCQVQHDLLNQQEIEWTKAELMEESSPALDIQNMDIPEIFTVLLHNFTEQIKSTLPSKAKAILQNLCDMEVDQRNILVKQVLTQELMTQDHESALWIHAILQIIWTHWAMQLKTIDVPATEERSECPCCGSDAVGSVVLQNADEANLRYLHCNLCNSRWNALRAKCTFCNNTKDMSLQSIDKIAHGALHGASGECCEACHAYRKMYHLSKEQYADPIADDLASLALDMLLGEAGYVRGGVNPFLIINVE